MANLTIEIPDELSRALKAIAVAQHKSVQQLAIERLESLLAGSPGDRAGAPAAVFTGDARIAAPDCCGG